VRLVFYKKHRNEEVRMGVLSNLEPKKVFYYFEEITKIPHGSGNVEQISNFMVDFAKAHKLFYIQDAMKNVIMVKEATPGYENEPVVILQGHMDMVAVQTPECTMDMKTEGLKVGTCGDNIYAENTSLGGDDGIAVAYALALLDSEDIRHPRLEVIITVDEEVGMDGAREIDLSMLQGHRMINLDSEDEGIFLTSCAGGARVNCRFPMKKQELTGVRYQLEVSGLLGGHSGGEIHKERGNSNCILGRLLWKLSEKMPVGLVSADGGLADNAIPRQTKAVVVVEEQDTESLEQQVAALAAELGDELATKDPDVKVTAKRLADTAETITCATPEATKRVAAFLQATPNGVQAMSADMPGLVQTSLNLGILKADAEVLRAEYSVRSSVESEKDHLIAKLAALVELTGGDYVVTGDYPGWKYRVHSPLREKMVKLYTEMYGTEPKVEAIHAGLECGLLGSKISDLDCVSMGPDMKDIHTTEETLSISSTKRVWEYLVKVLETKD